MEGPLARAGVTVDREAGGVALRIPLRVHPLAVGAMVLSLAVFVGMMLVFAGEAPPLFFAVFGSFSLLAVWSFAFLTGSSQRVTADAAGLRVVSTLYGVPVLARRFETGRIGALEVQQRVGRYGTPLDPVVRFAYEGRRMRPQVGYALTQDAAVELAALLEQGLGRGR